MQLPRTVSGKLLRRRARLTRDVRRGSDRDERERLLDNWESAAKGWGRQADRMQATARPISEWMIAHAGLAPGQRVLELAAGPGDTGFMAARLIEPGGTLICSDATAGMLDVARERAEEQGIDQRRVQAAAARVDRPARPRAST